MALGIKPCIRNMQGECAIAALWPLTQGHRLSHVRGSWLLRCAHRQAIFLLQFHSDLHCSIGLNSHGCMQYGGSLVAGCVCVCVPAWILPPLRPPGSAGTLSLLGNQNRDARVMLEASPTENGDSRVARMAGDKEPLTRPKEMGGKCLQVECL